MKTKLTGVAMVLVDVGLLAPHCARVTNTTSLQFPEEE
jgi:hypothetical protein